MRTAGSLMVVMMVAGCQCKPEGLKPVTASLRIVPQEVIFGPLFPDQVERTAQVDLINDGRGTLPVRWSLPEAHFVFDALPEVIQPGTTKVTVRFTPTALGTFSGRLRGLPEESEVAVGVSLRATVLEVPVCPPSNECMEARFDFVRRTCVESPKPEDTPCASDGNLCVVNNRCAQGRCVGDAVTCQDDNACTVDVCYPLTGCEFLPAPPCPGDGACLAGVCDPESGCGLTPREDGVSCGSTGESNSCTSVKVCIEGDCVTRDPPDGYICAEASPCASEGRCVDDQCVRARPPQPLQPRWTFDSNQDLTEDGGTLLGYHDFVLEPSGAATLTGLWYPVPILRANTAPVRAQQGASRRCILWGTRYVCADYPDIPSGQISAIDLSDGSTVWTFGIRVSAPELVAETSNMFLARLVVQGPDRLAAIYEAFPPGTSNQTQCRRYYIAVLDANGELVRAQRVQDPLLDVCNHPHPYGAASDLQGNLFIAFSPTQSTNAPLVPADTTLIMSWSRDGVFRWKRPNYGMRGGELAVARGLLYAEYASEVVDATSGVPVFSVSGLLGRSVVSASRLIPAPETGASGWTAYEAGGAQQRWHITLPENRVFWSDQLRLARWQTTKGARTVALTWVVESPFGQPTYLLHAVDVEDGSEAFSCPVEVPTTRTEPQLFEVANGSMTLLNSAVEYSGVPGCVKCDPPLALSNGAFSTYDTPTLQVPVAPWPGTFGGAGHDHRED